MCGYGDNSGDALAMARLGKPAILRLRVFGTRVTGAPAA